MIDEILDLDGLGQAERLRAGDATASELVEASIARIEKQNPGLNAVIHPLFEKARRQVAAGEHADGPFAGVPFVVKDAVCHTAGDPYHMGMQVLKDAGHVAETDTELVRRFRAAGFVFVGRTNTPELACSITTEPRAYGATRNPYDRDRSTGGSSGGSAAAVAARWVCAGHANDMGGSIRVPASHCGLVGLKPSRGRTTLAPHLGEYWGPLTHEHVLTRSVRDSAAILDATHGPAPGDPYTAPPPNGPWLDEVARDPGRLRIGRVEPVPGLEVDEACWLAAEKTAGVLVERGHRVEPVVLPPLERSVVGPWIVSGIARELDRVGDWLGRTIEREEVEPHTWMLAEIGRSLDAVRHVAMADDCWGWVRSLCEAWYGRFDVLLLPVTVSPPPPLGHLGPDTELGALSREMARHTRFTMPFDLTGEPAISLPVHETAGGLPVGAQLVAPVGREDLLFQLAAQVEAELGFEARRPG